MSKQSAAKHFMLIGIVLALLSVVLGAFGAHALKEKLTFESLGSYETGVRYQMFHALAIILFASIKRIGSSGFGRLGLWGFVVGTVLFSGSIYLLTTRAITGIGATSILGPLTPIGGMFLILGWLFCLLAVSKSNFE